MLYLRQSFVGGAMPSVGVIDIMQAKNNNLLGTKKRKSETESIIF